MQAKGAAGLGERTFLIAIFGRTPKNLVEEHLDELERLVASAGGVVVERALQERVMPDPSTIVGSGFLERLGSTCSDLQISSLIFDEDLTGSQVRNIERALPENIKVLDRAGVILDIFAQRARSREAQTQVELAQLNYILPRLTRRWTHLSRQTGGIGTRGVGETQLEIDRRLISRRISQLKKKLKVIERDRRLRRRRRNSIPSLALVGYTNAGKSSLFCRMAGADELVADKLFATLDPRARRATLGEGMTGVMVDTVGFIRKLPHHLVAPFRSTLEEATDAALLLHVIDASHPSWVDHLSVGNEVLDDLGVEVERRLVVLNKIDRSAGAHVELPDAVRVSAATGENIGLLLEAVRRKLLGASNVVFLRIPLGDNEMVERALKMPEQLALRFFDEHVDLALRSDDARLSGHSLDRYRIHTWDD